MRIHRSNALVIAGVLFLCSLCISVHAEQKEVFEDWEIHYSVFNSTFLDPEVAKNYDITRAVDRAVVTISVLNPELKSVKTNLKGTLTNQLSQEIRLNFNEIDDAAVYYVASVRFSDQEILKFKITAELPQGQRTLSFSQKLYWNR